MDRYIMHKIEVGCSLSPLLFLFGMTYGSFHDMGERQTSIHFIQLWSSLTFSGYYELSISFSYVTSVLFQFGLGLFCF